MHDRNFSVKAVLVCILISVKAPINDSDLDKQLVLSRNLVVEIPTHLSPKFTPLSLQLCTLGAVKLLSFCRQAEYSRLQIRLTMKLSSYIFM